MEMEMRRNATSFPQVSKATPCLVARGADGNAIRSGNGMPGIVAGAGPAHDANTGEDIVPQGRQEGATMRLCVPVNEDRGLDSPMSAHFGSASAFAIVDTGSDEVMVVPNSNRHHAHGTCQPLASIAGRDVGAVVVGGIGQGALARLHGAGVEVLHGPVATVRQAVELFRKGALTAWTSDMACSHHGQAHAGAPRRNRFGW
jgi:predicted Fe-Mo cluster-binding NifX family protein